MFETSIQSVAAWRSLGGYPPTRFSPIDGRKRVHSLQYIDFSDGETHEGYLFSGPSYAYDSLEDFVAVGLDKIIEGMGYGRGDDELNEVLQELSELSFRPVKDPKRTNLLNHVLPGHLGDLSYYDHPGVVDIAHFEWIFPASGGKVMSSGSYHFMYYWLCTG